MSHRFLRFVEKQGITATVFIVGELARSHQELVRHVAESGHEIGLHGLRHVPLHEVNPVRLLAELREGRDLLEDVSQTHVRGFRAPIFSLTPATGWAVDIITQAGFTYSSSIVPAANPRPGGWPGAPRVPFKWDSGLIELPCPVEGVGRMLVPFLGGIYLRYVPKPLAHYFLRRMDEQVIAWSYCHPYDIDPDEPFFVMPDAGWLTSRILYTRRSATLHALAATLAAAGAGRPLGVIAEQLATTSLPVMSSHCSSSRATRVARPQQ
jgi:polysaccharide deacetylase family protein (PEP-CTERM system associated)